MEGYSAGALNPLKTSLGIEFTFVSPANVPQDNGTDSSQEGSPYDNDEIASLVREIDRAITDAGLSTQILISEAASWKYLYSDEDTYRWNQISDFFSSSSTNYIGDLANVPNIIGGHSYGTDGNWNTMVETRRTVAQAAQAAGLRLYQTEWSMLGDGYSASEFVGYDNATEMDIALYMSKVIHCDLTYAGVSSWSYWTAVDLERWDHKNRFLLIKAVPSGGVYGDIKSSGTCQAAKTLWVLGNYSRFVRPGYSRIKLEMDKGSQKFFGNAFAAPDGNTVVAVYTNLSGEEYDVRAAIAGFNPSEIKTYTTNSDMDLEEGSVGGRNIPIKIKPNSVVTVVYKK